MQLPIDLTQDGYWVIEPGRGPAFTPTKNPVPYPVLRETVGGYIEHFQLSSEGAKHVPGGMFGTTVQYDGVKASMFLNEEGKLEGLPYNEIATRLAWLCCLPRADYIAGPVIILCGAANKEAEEGADLEDEDEPENIRAWSVMGYNSEGKNSFAAYSPNAETARADAELLIPSHELYDLARIDCVDNVNGTRIEVWRKS